MGEEPIANDLGQSSMGDGLEAGGCGGLDMLEAGQCFSRGLLEGAGQKGAVAGEVEKEVFAGEWRQKLEC